MVVILATKFTQIDKHFFCSRWLSPPAVPGAASWQIQVSLRQHIVSHIHFILHLESQTDFGS